MEKPQQEDVFSSLEKLQYDLEEKFVTAMQYEKRGAWSVGGKVDSDKINALLKDALTISAKDTFLKPRWIIATRNPHLYPMIIKRANDHSHWHHDTEPAEDTREELELHIAEEQLHGVPTLGEKNVSDRIYGVAFLYDTVTRKPIVQPFFSFIDRTGNLDLIEDVATNPSRILGEKLGEMDKKLLN
ncbi:MAG: hypothetical protein UW80_C0045G0005 [Microgenomates group bacterium GW2011_GWC1_44_9]|nr:MAG: hypothetical protein UW80_C0045G0005 [Microgenomates group bacterium GW2011_GWC1_44_9]